MALVEGSAAGRAVWCQGTYCAAPPLCKQMQALTFQLKLSLKPGGGGDCLFSEAVFDQCCGADLCRWQKLLLLSEGALERSNLDIHIGYSHGTCPNCSGIDHRAMWGNGDPYVMIHKEFLFLGNVLPLSVKCVTYLFTYAKFNYFTTCLWCSAIR